MAINLSDNINSNSPKILDKRYGPWSSVNDANTNVPSPQRAQGLTVGILSGSGIVEYWYYSGTTDTDLIFKTGGGSGIAGTSGTSGTSGIDGTSGTSGIDGTSGTSGVSGTSGTSGVSGTSGTSGVSGTSGTSGIDGTSGTSGIDGTSGTSGISGTSGTSGIDGTSGTSGISGTSGTSGIDGTSGTSGSSGTSGTSPGSVYDELYYDSDTKTLHVPNIALTGSTIIASNLPIASEDPQNRLVLSGDTIYLLTGATTGSTNINLLEYGGLDVVSGDTYFTRFDSSLDASLSVPNTIGGIAAGTTVADLTGKTLVQLFNDLLFPTVQPTYTIPSIAMTGVSNATVEAGSTYTASISGYGNKNDAGQFTQLRIVRNSSPLQTYTGAGLTQSSITDIAAQFGYVDPNNPNYRYTINPTPYSESYVIPSGAPSTTTYYVDGNYDAGLTKQDNKGNYDVRTPALRSPNAPQTAGTAFESTTYTISGLIPYFWGTFDTGTTVTKELIASAISGGTANKVLAAASGTLSIPYNIPSDWKYIWVAYPAIYTTKTKWFVSVFDSGDIDGTFITTAVTQNVDSPNGYWSGISFKMHWSVNATIQSTFEYRN